MQILSNNMNFNSPGLLLGSQERFKVYYRNIWGRRLKNEKKINGTTDFSGERSGPRASYQIQRKT